MKNDHVKLTVIDLEFENRVAKTPIGMAYWAGTGPRGKTCRECSHYVFNGYTSSKSANGGILKRGQCQRFIVLTNIKTHRLPFDTPSCKEFQQNDKPPSITDQGNI